MARYTHKKKEEIGLSPNALVLRGIRRMEHPALRLTDYSGDEVIERACPPDADLSALAAPGRFVWLNVSGLHDATLMQRIGGTLGIPLHVLSDIMDTGVRPKAEEFDGGLFITLKSLRYGKRGGHVSADSVSLVLLGDLLLSFQEEEDGLFDPVRARLRKSPAKMREAGSDYLAFALLDVVIDHYLYVAGEMGERIERLEDRLYDRSGGGTDRDLLGQTVRYKRELSLLRKHVHPAREVTAQLAKSDADCLHTANRAHFHELLDNAKEADDVCDTYREMLYDLMNLYHTRVGERLNDIMKVLTIISVTFIPISFIAGVYGTNFDRLPGQHWRYGFLAMLGIMAAVAGFMLWYFKRKKWW